MATFRTYCKSKIQHLHITAADLEYEGSITLDPLIMEKADILPYEQVQVLNMNNGSRLDTYAIAGERGSGICCLNGPAARMGLPGDRIIVISYVTSDEPREPHIVHVDKNNQIKQ